jgi:hypothetical protein
MSNTLPQPATPGDSLSPVQEKALTALLAGKTVMAATQEARVDRTTVYRWLRGPDRPGFRLTLARGRRELRQAIRARLLAMADKAADCLGEERVTMVTEDPPQAGTSPSPEEEIRAALLRLLDRLAEKVAQKILRELDAKERQAQ